MDYMPQWMKIISSTAEPLHCSPVQTQQQETVTRLNEREINFKY